MGIYFISQAKTGLSALALKRQLGVSYPTAWLIHQKLMQAMGRFQDALALVTRLVNIGDCKTLACHPATTTHRQLGPAEMAKAGVSEDMIRLSVGIEHVDDLIADLDQALNAA